MPRRFIAEVKNQASMTEPGQPRHQFALTRDKKFICEIPIKIDKLLRSVDLDHEISISPIVYTSTSRPAAAHTLEACREKRRL